MDETASLTRSQIEQLKTIAALEARVGLLETMVLPAHADLLKTCAAQDARIGLLEHAMRSLRGSPSTKHDAPHAPHAPHAPPHSATIASHPSCPSAVSLYKVRCPEISFSQMIDLYEPDDGSQFFKTVQAKARVSDDSVAEGLALTVAALVDQESARPNGAPLSVQKIPAFAAGGRAKYDFLIYDGHEWRTMAHDDLARTLRVIMRRVGKYFRARHEERPEDRRDFLKMNDIVRIDVAATSFVKLALRKLHDALPDAPMQ